MVKVYVNLIKKGLKTLGDVPLSIRLAVETALEKEAGENVQNGDSIGRGS